MGIGSSKEEDESSGTATFDKKGNPTNEAADNVVKGITENVRHENLTNAATTLMEDLKQVGEAEDNVEQKKAQLKVDTETATRLADFAGETEGAGGAARAKKAAAWAAGKVAGKAGLGGKARRDESPSKPTAGGGRKKRKIQSKTKKRKIQSKTKKSRIQSKTKKRRIQSKTKKSRIQSKTKKRRIQSKTKKRKIQSKKKR